VIADLHALRHHEGMLKLASPPQGAGTPIFFLRHRSPDVASVGGHHGLAGLTAEGLAELGHVLHYAVDAELPGRVGIGLHLQAELFGSVAAAPVLAMSKEELLLRSVAILFLREVDILAFGVCEERDIGKP